MVLATDFVKDGAEHNFFFDFENEVMKNEGRPGMTSADEATRKDADNRFRRVVVCRHWVQDLCMKSDDCEYLHELNPQRMPDCRWGEKCQVPDCLFKHTKEEDRVECTFYKIGFCRKGPVCRFRHVRRAPEECPEEIDWDNIDDRGGALAITEVTVVGADGVERKTVVQHNDMYKVAICKHWQRNNGVCPFGDRCHFAHGAHELRNREEDEEGGNNEELGGGDGAQDGPATSSAVQSAPKTQLSELVAQFKASHEPVDTRERIGDLPDTQALSSNSPVAYVVCRVPSDIGPDGLLASMQQMCWSVLPCFMEPLNKLFERCPGNVFIYFAADTEAGGSFMGVARMESRVTEVDGSSVPFVRLPREARNKAFLFQIRWMFPCDLPFKKTAQVASWDDDTLISLPVAMSPECNHLRQDAGHTLMELAYRHRVGWPEVEGEHYMGVSMAGPHPNLAPLFDEHEEEMKQFYSENPTVLRQTLLDALGADAASWLGEAAVQSATSVAANAASATGGANLVGPEGVPVGPGSVVVPNKPAFVVGVSSKRFGQEMIEHNVFAAPEERRADMAFVQRGTFMVLLNVEEDRLFGVFEALGPAEEMPFPQLFIADGAGDDASVLPWQVRVRRVLNAPPLFVKQVPRNILPAIEAGGSEAACFSLIAPPQMQNLANLFARIAAGRSGSKTVAIPAASSTEGGDGGIVFFPGVAGDQTTSDYPPGISVHPLQGKAPGQYSRKVVVNVPFRKEFKAAHQFIGKKGANVQAIQKHGVRCTVKALETAEEKKSGVNNPGAEIEGAMQIVFFGNDLAGMDAAEAMIREMASDIVKRYSEEQSHGGPRSGGMSRGGPRDDSSQAGGSRRGSGRPEAPRNPRLDDAASHASSEFARRGGHLGPRSGPPMRQEGRGEFQARGGRDPREEELSRGPRGDPRGPDPRGGDRRGPDPRGDPRGWDDPRGDPRFADDRFDRGGVDPRLGRGDRRGGPPRDRSRSPPRRR